MNGTFCGDRGLVAIRERATLLAFDGLENTHERLS